MSGMPGDGRRNHVQGATRHQPAATSGASRAGAGTRPGRCPGGWREPRTSPPTRCVEEDDAFVPERLVPAEQPRQVGRFWFFLGAGAVICTTMARKPVPRRQVGHDATDSGLTHPALCR